MATSISITAPTHHEILQRIWSFSLILVLAQGLILILILILVIALRRLRKWWLILPVDRLRLVLDVNEFVLVISERPVD